MKAVGLGETVKLVEAGICPFCHSKVDIKDFRDELSLKEYTISGLCQKCQDETFSNSDEDEDEDEVYPESQKEIKTRPKLYEAKEDEFVEESYQMFSGQGEAVSHKYHKYIGKSGNIWLVADSKSPADNIYVTNNPQNTTDKNSRWAGFGGATLKMPLVEGGVFELHGGWHTNSESLFCDTGVDLRDKHETFVVLSKEMEYTEDGTYRRIFKGIVYKDDKPIFGPYHRYEDLIRKYPEAQYYYMKSHGGGSSGSCEYYRKKS